MVLADFEQTEVRRGAAPAEARKLDAQDVERLMREFLIQPPDMGEAGTFQSVMEAGAGEAPRGDTGGAPMAGTAPPVFEVSQKDLITPDVTSDPLQDAKGFFFAPLGFQMPGGEAEIQQIREIQDQVIEKKTETEIVEDVVTLPDFPGLPDM